MSKHSTAGNFNTNVLRSFAVLILLIVQNGISTTSFAWKPATHAYLAEVAREDAIDDGRVTIQRVDFWNKTITGTIGTYEVDAAVLEALRNFPDHYRAGVIGPDAYPDPMAGQSVIHPKDDSQGTTAWLDMLWRNANTPQERAFVTGFLTHAAGDMYGHTFVNFFAGGPFTFDPVDNAVRHTLVETYVDKHCPSPSFNISIDGGVDSFIYNNIVNAWRTAPAGPLYRRILDGKIKGEGTLPYTLSTLREIPADYLQNYYARMDWYREKIRTTSWPVDNYWISVMVGYATINALPVWYAEAWVDDIDRALQELPRVSTELARVVIFNPSFPPDLVQAETILRDYWRDYLLSALGVPDAFAAATGNATFDLMERIGVQALKEKFEQALASGELLPLLAPLANPAAFADLISDVKAQLDQEMNVNDENEEFQWQQFSAAYNTVTMTKLLYLSDAGRRQLMADLGYPRSNPVAPAVDIENAMIGFQKSLDESLQWRANVDKMFLHWDCYLYQKVFMNQIGDHNAAPYQYTGFSGLPVQCASIQQVRFLGEGSVCAPVLDGVVGLDGSADRYGAVIDFEASGQAIRGPAPRHLWVAPNQGLTGFSVALNPVLNSETITVSASRQNTVSATRTIRPPQLEALRLEDQIGNLFAYGRDGRILGGEQLTVEVNLDCASIPPGTKIFLSLCPANITVTPGQPLPSECISAEMNAVANRLEYWRDLILPYVTNDTDYILNVNYLDSVSSKTIKILSSRVKSLSLTPQTVMLSALPGNNPTLSARLVLMTPAGPGGEIIHLQYASLASATGQTPTSTITVPAGQDHLEFTVTIPIVGVIQSNIATSSILAWLSAMSDLDPSDYVERWRSAQVTLMQPFRTHGQWLVFDDRMWAFADGDWWREGLGPCMDLIECPIPSELIMTDKNSNPLWTRKPGDLGLSATSQFGGNVVFIGDLDGDQFSEIAIASPLGDFENGSGDQKNLGAVFILSGKTGRKLGEIAGQTPNAHFGSSLAVLNGKEIAIGAPGTKQQAGEVHIADLKSLAVTHILKGKSKDDHFGTTVASLGDLDQDGKGDWLIGAPNTKAASGAVYMALTSKSMTQLKGGVSQGDNFGRSLLVLPGSGFVVGAPNATRSKSINGKAVSLKETGEIYYFDLKGKLTWTLTGKSAGEKLGSSLAVFNPDKSSEAKSGLLIGAPGAQGTLKDPSVQLKNAGGIYVVDQGGKVNKFISGQKEGAQLGTAIFANSGPVGSDGMRGAIIGSANSEDGYFRLE